MAFPGCLRTLIDSLDSLVIFKRKTAFKASDPAGILIAFGCKVGGDSMHIWHFHMARVAGSSFLHR